MVDFQKYKIENYARDDRIKINDFIDEVEKEINYKRKDFIFHDKRTTTGVGSNWLEVGTYKSLLVDISGDAENVVIEFKSNSDHGFAGLYGQNTSTLEYAKSAGIGGGLWIIDITGHSQIMMDVATISGGSVTVKGVATTSSANFITLPTLKTPDMIKHVFHDKRTTTGAGTNPLSVPLADSYTKVYIHISGTATSRTLEFKGITENDAAVGITAYDLLNSYNPSKVATGNGNQVWLIEDVQAFKSIQVWVASISSGDVTVIGRVVKS